MALGYLLDPFIQIQNDNGTPIVGAKIYVYNADTTNLAVTYNDFESHLNTNPILTDTLGNATIIADDGIEYDISVHDANDLLLFTKKYVSVDKTSSAGGTTQVVAGYGVTVNRVGNTFTVSVDTDLIATKDDLTDKQDKLQAGANIEITDANVINVVNRREIVVQDPIKIERSPTRLKLYIDDNYAGQFKSKQNEVIIGGGSANYISKVTQTENGNVSADVGNFVAGSNINISKANDNLIISGKNWTNDINAAVSGKIDKVIGGVGSQNNPVYYDETSGVLPCFTNDQTFMGLDNTYIDSMSGFHNVMYGNSNTYNFSHTDQWAPSSPHENVVVGYNNNETVSGSNSYLYDTCIFGTNNNLTIQGGSNIFGIGNSNTFSGTNGGFINKCGIAGDNNEIIVSGDNFSTYQHYIFGYDNAVHGDGWGAVLFGAENETNGESNNFLYGYRNKINDSRALYATFIGLQNTINATNAETHRLSDTVLLGEYNVINAANRTSDTSQELAFGYGNTFTNPGYQNLAYGYSNSVGSGVSRSMTFGQGLVAENDKIKFGETNCYLEIDIINKKIYKVINGTRTEI